LLNRNYSPALSDGICALGCKMTNCSVFSVGVLIIYDFITYLCTSFTFIRSRNISWVSFPKTQNEKEKQILNMKYPQYPNFRII
jgi:hypothetical protein